jgi:hypothetical protein
MNAQRIVADELHIDNRDVRWNRARIENSDARILIDAACAIAVAAESEESVLPLVLGAPSNP